MISIGAALGVGLIAFGMVITPGPNMMYLVSRTLTQGRRAGLVSLSGVVTGFALYVLATATGLSLLFHAVPELFLTVKLLGATYLLWLAFGMVRRGTGPWGGPDGLPRHSTGRLYALGLTTCLLNPKIALMYGALLPQFVRPGDGPAALQLVELGLVQVVVAAVINTGWVLVAARGSRWLNRSPGIDRSVRWTSAGLLTFFAVHLGLARAAA